MNDKVNKFDQEFVRITIIITVECDLKLALMSWVWLVRIVSFIYY